MNGIDALVDTLLWVGGIVSLLTFPIIYILFNKWGLASRITLSIAIALGVGIASMFITGLVISH